MATKIPQHQQPKKLNMRKSIPYFIFFSGNVLSWEKTILLINGKPSCFFFFEIKKKKNVISAFSLGGRGGFGAWQFPPKSTQNIVPSENAVFMGYIIENPPSPIILSQGVGIKEMKINMFENSRINIYKSTKNERSRQFSKE